MLTKVRHVPHPKTISSRILELLIRADTISLIMDEKKDFQSFEIGDDEYRFWRFWNEGEDHIF